MHALLSDNPVGCTSPSADKPSLSARRATTNASNQAWKNALPASPLVTLSSIPCNATVSAEGMTVHQAILDMRSSIQAQGFATVLADPPWRFVNRSGKIAPEHRRLRRYETMSTIEIASLPVKDFMRETAHLYLWVPNALLPQGLFVLDAWGFTYKANIIWHKIRSDGQSDKRGVGFYFRNVTEILLFGVRGKKARTLAPARSQVNIIHAKKREHSRKPSEQYDLIEACSTGPYLELFGRGTRPGWTTWGDEAVASYKPSWPTYRSATSPTNDDLLSVLNGVGGGRSLK